MGKRLLSFSFLFFAIMILSTAQMVSPNDLNSAPTGPPLPITGNNNSNGPGEKRKIEIKNADFMELRTNLDVQIRRLVGNVKIKDADALFYCDSAIVNVTLNTIDAFGHVHIKKGDTIDIWGDKLFYDGNTKSGNITQNVKLRDRKLLLTTPILDYNLNEDIGIFRNGGVLKQAKSTLTSESGVYYHQKSTCTFNGNVVYVDEKTKMYADSMRFNTNTEIATFLCRTHIVTDESDIWTDAGYYDTKKEKAFFTGKTILKKDKGILEAENVNYDNENKKGLAEKNVIYTDSTERITILGDKLYYQSDSTLIKATNDPFLIKEDDNDTLYISADTLFSFQIPKVYEDTMEKNKNDTIRILYAYHHVKVLKGRISAICDSLYFSYQDSIIKLYQNPVVWIDTTQFSADSILIYTKNDEIDFVYLNGKCLIVNQSDPGYYNQVKGRNIQGFFEDGDLNLMKVNGNAESLYYIKDDSSAYIGANKALCSQMDIYFSNDSLQKIAFLDNPEGAFLPMSSIDEATGKLEGFFWIFDKKPITKYDIIRNNNAFQIERMKALDAKRELELKAINADNSDLEGKEE